MSPTLNAGDSNMRRPCCIQEKSINNYTTAEQRYNRGYYYSHTAGRGGGPWVCLGRILRVGSFTYLFTGQRRGMNELTHSVSGGLMTVQSFNAVYLIPFPPNCFGYCICFLILLAYSPPYFIFRIKHIVLPFSPQSSKLIMFPALESCFDSQGKSTVMA